MTLLSVIENFLTKALGMAVNVRAILTAAKTAAPDLTTIVDDLLSKLDEPFTEGNVAALAAAIPPELFNILRLHFDTRPHAGDAI